MKKTIIFKFLTIAIMFGLFSCNENKITYDGPWFVHFGQSSYDFQIAGSVKVPVFLTSPLQSNDVTANISVSSDNLVEGVDYIVDKKEVTFKAGTLSDTLTFTGLDTDIPKGLTISLSFESISGDFSIDNSEQSFATINVLPNFLVVYKSVGLTPEDGETWAALDLAENGFDVHTGIWYNGTTIHAEMYGRNVSATLNSDGLPELNPVEEGTLIGPDFSGWVGNYGWSSTDWWYIPVLASETYTALYGTSFMIAAQIEVNEGVTSYAWIKYSVNADGTKATLIEYAYEATGKPLTAGQKE